MKNLFVFALALVLCVLPVDAQLLKGDMNDDGVLDVIDVNASVSTIIGARDLEYISSGDVYHVDNSLVAGTWYNGKNNCFTLNSDGTTDYTGASKYLFLSNQSRIIFINSLGNPCGWIDVMLLNEGIMWGSVKGSGEITVYSSTKPVQLVESVELSKTSLELEPQDSEQLTATVLPNDADNKTVTWTSSNNAVATVAGGIITGVSYGTAVITCAATDGSGMKATCEVTVKKIDRSGRDSNGREWVDLDLPGRVLWAAWNVGATKAEDYGLYFAWGETQGYKGDASDGHVFDWAHYKWMTKGKDDWKYINKYQIEDEYTDAVWYNNKTFVGDGIDVLDAVDDAATVNWGSEWRMPTKQEMKDLFNEEYCTWTTTSINGVKCYEFKSKSNGNCIYFPAAGQRYYSYLFLAGHEFYYWTNTLSDRTYNAYALNGKDIERWYGNTVRAVRVSYK